MEGYSTQYWLQEYLLKFKSVSLDTVERIAHALTCLPPGRDSSGTCLRHRTHHCTSYGRFRTPWPRNKRECTINFIPNKLRAPDMMSGISTCVVIFLWQQWIVNPEKWSFLLFHRCVWNKEFSNPLPVTPSPKNQEAHLILWHVRPNTHHLWGRLGWHTRLQEIDWCL